MRYIITYDIEDNSRRTNIHKILKSYGTPVQKSVFECVLNKVNYLKLRKRLEKVISYNNDNIRFYFICDSCSSKIELIGSPKIKDEKEEMFIL